MGLETMTWLKILLTALVGIFLSRRMTTMSAVDGVSLIWLAVYVYTISIVTTVVSLLEIIWRLS